MQKIAEASLTLKELNEILAVQRVKVADQTKNCEQLLASIGESTDIAMEKKQLGVQKREEIEEQRKIIDKEEKEAKLALAEAAPALQAARAALAELEKADITEIRCGVFRFIAKSCIQIAKWNERICFSNKLMKHFNIIRVLEVKKFFSD